MGKLAYVGIVVRLATLIIGTAYPAYKSVVRFVCILLISAKSVGISTSDRHSPAPTYALALTLLET